MQQRLTRISSSLSSASSGDSLIEKLSHSLSLVIRGQCDQMARMYIQYFAI